ncbi:MAG: hypothetical protein H6558_20610 [Lewinellaceae bacterium]|nr:hypothetical protein [Lewinellaceae bacterium]
MKNILITILFSFIGISLNAQSLQLSRNSIQTNQVVRLNYSMGNYSFFRIRIQAYENNRYIIIEDMDIRLSGFSNIQFNQPGTYYIGAYDANGNLITGQWVEVSGRSDVRQRRVVIHRSQNQQLDRS